MFKDDDLIAEPGKKFSYTTHGFTLASAVLEKASGKEFKKLVEDLTFQLGMRHTTLDVNKRVIPNRTKQVAILLFCYVEVSCDSVCFSYYMRNDKHTLENCPEVDNSYKWAGGGILSDVADLLTFANAILYRYPSSLKIIVAETFVSQN
ncbi:hypothetical protein Y032_0165g17 [Ancylostoma ceylanicum]|nr:hypothetical protein Y032_0165g17 [Ancylostoma ceylanicum]